MKLYTNSPPLFDPLEEEYEAEGLSLAAGVPDEGHPAQVIDLLHLERAQKVGTQCKLSLILIGVLNILNIFL